MPLKEKRFKKNDSGFICVNCGREVSVLGYTSRNHCPYCLWSLHVDINPGDRASECKAPLEPISAVTDSKKGFIIVHRCTKCGELRRNKAARDDDMRKIISLTVNKLNG